MFRAEVGSRAAHDIGGGNRKGPTQTLRRIIYRASPSSELATMRSITTWPNPLLDGTVTGGPPMLRPVQPQKACSAPSSSNVQEILTVPVDPRQRAIFGRIRRQFVNGKADRLRRLGGHKDMGSGKSPGERSLSRRKGQAGGA